MSPTKPTFKRLAALLALIGALGVATLGMDSLLHAAGLAWMGRDLGSPGTLLLVASLSDSLRKRHLISIGSSREFLALHPFAGWLSRTPSAYSRSGIGDEALEENRSGHRYSQSSLSTPNTGSWRAAAFDHTRYFLIAGDPRVSCSTCHTQPTFAQYTCYGCHEYTPERIAREHREEGISRFNDWVECRRSGTEPKHDD